MKFLTSLQQTLALLLFFAFAPEAFSQTCESCLQVRDPLVPLPSYDGSFERRVCYYCANSAPCCFVCKLPALKNSHRHDDKRLFCERDFREGIFEHGEMDRLAHQTMLDLNRAFFRFKMNFGVSNVTVSLVSSATLYDVMKRPFDPQNAGTVGLCVTRCFDADGKEVKFEERIKQPSDVTLRYEHQIYVANGFPENKLKAILAHELAHVWIHENLPVERAEMLDSDTVEGFCELVAYQMMENENAVHVRTSIRKNLYTVGQQNILIEVESGYGFNRILQWLYKGTNRRLQNADLVRQVSDAPLPIRRPPPAKPAAPIAAVATTNTAPIAAEVPMPAPVQPQPPARPTTVILKGIFFGKNRSALINDLTLGEGEEQQLRLAEGYLGVKCIEIKPASVILAVNGETKEYFVGRPAIPVVSGETK